MTLSDWFNLLAVQKTLKSILQHHSSKISVLRGSAFFVVQLSHHIWLLEKPYLWLDRSLSAKWCPCFLTHCLGFSSVPFSSVPHSCPTLCNPTECSKPDLPVHHELPGLIQAHVHWVGDAIQPSHPLSSPSPPTFNFPSIRVYSNESVLNIRWPKYCSFSFSISLSNEYSGLMSFRMDWLDLLEVQGTLKSLLQCHSSKASILWCF